MSSLKEEDPTTPTLPTAEEDSSFILESKSRTKADPPAAVLEKNESHRILELSFANQDESRVAPLMTEIDVASSAHSVSQLSSSVPSNSTATPTPSETTRPAAAHLPFSRNDRDRTGPDFKDQVHTTSERRSAAGEPVVVAVAPDDQTHENQPAAAALQRQFARNDVLQRGPEYKDQVRSTMNRGAGASSRDSNTVVANLVADTPPPAEATAELFLQDNWAHPPSAAHQYPPQAHPPPAAHQYPPPAHPPPAAHQYPPPVQERKQWSGCKICGLVSAVICVSFVVLIIVAGVVGGDEDENENGSLDTINIGDARETAIVDFVNNITLSSNKPIAYPRPASAATAEELAVAFLIDATSLLILNTPSQKFLLTQKYALLTLWYSTNGDNWLENDGWLVADDECTWFGIECDQEYLGNGIGVQNAVISLALPSNNLSGDVPADIALLVYLSERDLRNNTNLDGYP